MMADKKNDKKFVVLVQYGDADMGPKQHDFSKDRDLKQHTAQLCKLFGIQDSPEPYVISVRQNEQHYKYLSQQVKKKEENKRKKKEEKKKRERKRNVFSKITTKNQHQ